MLDDINREAASIGGTWVKLQSKADGVLEGTVVNAEVRGMTFEGDPVLNRKTGEQRREWVLALVVNGETVKVSLKEAAQRAIATALSEANSKLAEGGTLKIAVTADPPDTRSQATYKAKYTPPVAGFVAPVAEDEEPF